MQIKFAICCKKIHKVGCENSQSDGSKKIHKVGCENSQSDGRKVNNYQQLKTISCRRIKRIKRSFFFVQNVPKWIKKSFQAPGILSGKTDEVIADIIFRF